MEMIKAVVGIVINKGSILVVQGSKDHPYFKNLFIPPMTVRGHSPGDEKSELEKLADEFSEQLGVGFDFSKGTPGKVFTFQENPKRAFQILPLKGELTKYDNFDLGPHYSEVMWLTPGIARSITLGPIFDACLSQFGL